MEANIYDYIISHVVETRLFLYANFPSVKVLDEIFLVLLSVFEPGVRHKFVDAPPEFGLFLQTLVHEVAEVGRPLVLVDFGRRVVSNII